MSAHRDRMKKLHEQIQKLVGTRQGRLGLVRQAQTKLQEAEMLLEEEGIPPAGAGGMMSQMQGNQMQRMQGAGGMMQKMMGGMMRNTSKGPAVASGTAAGKSHSGSDQNASEPLAPADEPASPAMARSMMAGGMQGAMGRMGGGMGGGMAGLSGGGGMAGMSGGGMGGGGGGMSGMSGGGMGAMMAAETSPQRRTSVTTHSIVVAATELAIRDKNPKSKVVHTKLDEPISMSFQEETPLEDVLKYIKQATTTKTYAGIPIYVDPRASGSGKNDDLDRPQSGSRRGPAQDDAPAPAQAAGARLLRPRRRADHQLGSGSIAMS